MSTAADDRLAIIEVCTRWHRLVDQKRWTALHDVLDEVVSLPTLEEAAAPGFDVATYLGAYRRRRDDIIRHYPSLLDGLVTQHLVAGHLVDLVGDAAVCHAHSINVHVTTGPSPVRVEHGNEYRFDVVRTGNGWRVRGRVTWQRWSTGNEEAHDVPSKQRAWVEAMAGGEPNG